MTSTGTILIVDDNRDDVVLLLRVLKQLRVINPIVTCEGADQAIQHLETHDLPRIMLLDLKMPGKDGFYVLNQVRTHPEWKDLTVIVLTTSSDIQDIVLAYEVGANSFVTKPFDLVEFREIISAIYQFWVIRNQPPPKRARVVEKPF